MSGAAQERKQFAFIQHVSAKIKTRAVDNR